MLGRIVVALIATGLAIASSAAAFQAPIIGLPERHARHVEVVGDAQSGYALHVNGHPYTVYGVGIGQPSDERFAALVKAGGNTVRTWSQYEADKVFELAEKHGVMVALGLDFGQELHGFDYDNEEAVAQQFARTREAVLRYKDHPNLLMYIVGNELNLLFDDEGEVAPVNAKAYIALNDVAEFIHQVDPHHPVSTAFAGYLTHHVDRALPYLPNLDILSVQLYGDLVRMPEFLAGDRSGIPIMITEYGPIGHWEMPKTAWGREIEEPSALKARGMAERIDRFIANDQSGRIIGNFAFYWGHKQERTSTWYSMFTPEGRPDARADELSRYWTGSYPANRAPMIEWITLAGKGPLESVKLAPGAEYTAEIDLWDPESDPLSTEWILRREVSERSEGGGLEAAPPEVPLTVVGTTARTVTFRAPIESGEYRLFATSSDPGQKIATANIPLMVE
ncbi:hypothetical protein HK107_02040 [Parvularcula sp. ZS-1/3]|uniref:Glycoside hydrolase family 2 catalytic domain-containing protein n=1 Tax=Parvularcula mediterranea TaxID=2732508 RepID=A0A7Y3RJ98_9PROT|nr:glycoside hydrolase family 2 TIM barrel-domain containing protein [Parvularcula mediterranea]NNU15104.1 hypothetical protein [Parvularcula mediterranea]